MASNSTQSSGLFDAPDNHSSLINIVTWFLAVTSFLAIFARLGTKWALTNRFGWDDGCIVLSMLFTIGQTLAVTVEADNGLGKHAVALTASELVAFEKSAYSANILFLASQCFAKLSVVLLIRHITPAAHHKRLSYALAGAIITWAVISMIVVLFQCHVPETWNFIANKCIDRRALWNYSNIANIILDVCLILLPASIVWGLQVRIKHKIVVISCFGARILTIAALVAQIILSQGVNNTLDASFDYWPATLTMEVVQSLGIITACVPYLKPFLESLESGMIRSDDLRRRGGGTVLSERDKKSTKNSSLGSREATRSTIRNNRGDMSHELGERGSNLGGNSHLVTSVTANRNQGNGGDWEVESQSSGAKIIKETRTWEVSSTNDI